MGRGVPPPLSPPKLEIYLADPRNLSWVILERVAHPQNSIAASTCSKSRPRAISTGPLNALLRLHVPPIKVVVSDRPYSLEGMGALISRWASRLDAFSGYPIQTWLISSAVGTTTEPPDDCSTRSARCRQD